MRVLLVCTGNTCRSPLAEVILRSELKKVGLAGVSVTSAGVAAIAGGRATENAKLAARELGLSLAGFRSKPVTERRVKMAELILTMNEYQKQEIVRTWPFASEKTTVISEFSSSGRKGIDDPLGGTLDAYLRCARQLRDEACRIVKCILSKKRTRSGSRKKRCVRV